ncbi:MAG: hypothetical protein ACYDDF_03095 [Thermoplasmatota archaeon]
MKGLRTRGRDAAGDRLHHAGSLRAKGIPPGGPTMPMDFVVTGELDRLLILILATAALGACQWRKRWSASRRASSHA